MSPFTSSFPRFGDGDVLIRLSEKPDDTLQLHSDVLARTSDFFKTSLSDERWSNNKVFVSDSGASLKLLELTFDDPEILPGLLGRTKNTPEETLRHQRAVYDAHKTLFAMIYDLAIDIGTNDITKMATLIPTVVALADAYAMLSRFGSKIHELLFKGDNGFHVIAQCPFGMLTVAFGLHAIVLEVKENSGDDEDESDGSYFARIGETELQEAFDKHVKTLRRQMKTL
ncbi:hypothetical protein KC316_g12320, partial [Hortaea werneckii]